MKTIHTRYIKKLSDDTGRTYRELESLWSKFENDVENERLMDPNRFSHLKSTDGSMSQEIDKKLREYINNPSGVTEEEQTESEVKQIEDEFATDIQNNLNTDDTAPELIEDEFIADEESESIDDNFADLFDASEEDISEEDISNEVETEETTTEPIDEISETSTEEIEK